MSPLLVALLIVSAQLACARGSTGHVSGVYLHDSRLLVRLDSDTDGDGRIDVRTYIRHARAVRLEADSDRDGDIDRWEYYGTSGALVKVGASTRADGREDTWARLDGNQRHIETSTARDGRIDRRETYEGATLVRVETDTNHDGLPDRWERFQGGVLAEMSLDEERRSGRPTRRIVYGAGGTARVETVPAHDDDAAR